MISVIMATYNRSEIIGFSIRSVLQQTYADWELLVIGDACTDDTESVVASFQDPRIQFFNLSQRFGDQSGPTNFGIQLAKGEFLAFLNHDDLWFSDHLEQSLAQLKRSNSDLVYALQIDADPGVGESTLRIPLIYLEDFTPIFAPNISTWTCRRQWALSQAPMRPFHEIFTYPSIDWLLSAWKRGSNYSRVPAVTVFVLTTLTRKNTYLNKNSEEHAFWFHRIFQEPNSREQMLVSVLRNPHPTHLQGYSSKWLLRGLFLRLCKQALQYLGLNVVACVVYFRCPKKWGIFPTRGSLRKKIYLKRGLNLGDLCR